tara:strand:+ start:149 stop:727 length:579 start_codon:yes stop_codon:yes gene_type:complete
MKTLEEIYKGHSMDGKAVGHGDKGTAHTYIPEYERLFTPFRDKKINILEIGIAYGESLELWYKYFNNAKVFGADIHDIEIFSDKFYPGGYKNDERFTIWISDATKPEFLDVIGDTKFDIIIDDGSHQLHDQIASYELLKNRMNPGGLYIIEDISNITIDAIEFEERHDGDVEIYDGRAKKNRYDDALVICKF